MSFSTPGQSAATRRHEQLWCSGRLAPGEKFQFRPEDYGVEVKRIFLTVSEGAPTLAAMLGESNPVVRWAFVHAQTVLDVGPLLGFRRQDGRYVFEYEECPVIIPSYNSVELWLADAPGDYVIGFKGIAASLGY